MATQKVRHIKLPRGANAPRVWSSSENGGSAAWARYFADGATGATSKSNEYLAVPVRRFNTI